jgi:molecular chaperone GrpE (heat shock protein)
MPIQDAPKIPKWPFFTADAALLLTAAAILFVSKFPITGLTAVAIACCCSAGAGILVFPFLREHSAAVKLWEQANLAEAAQQIDRLVSIANHIATAGDEWKAVQEAANKTNRVAGSLIDRISTESKAFADFLGRADAQEKQTMRFEMDKMRRAEAEMLQVLVHLLDHVYALYQGAQRSGQSQLVQQLAKFRAACLDTARRVGVVAYEAQQGDAFNPQSHQTVDGQEPKPDLVVVDTVACGYSFQGQPVRRILVAMGKPGTDPFLTSPAESSGDGEFENLNVGPAT